MVEKMKVLSLCDGMGGGYLALNELGYTFGPFTTANQYYAVEIDKHARKLADANLPNIIRPEHNVLNINRAWIKKHGPFDLVLFGSPCQSLSNLGTRKGLDGKSRIFLDCMRVLRIAQDYSPKLKFLIENVKMQEKFKREFDKYIKSEGLLVNSNLVSAQNRERYYWSNFEMKPPKRESYPIARILEARGKDVEKIYAVNYSSSTRYVDNAGKVFSSPAEGRKVRTDRRLYFTHKSNTLVTGVGCANNKSGTMVVEVTQISEDAPKIPSYGILYYHEGKNLVPPIYTALACMEYDFIVRHLTVREAARLQTIPDGYDFSSVSPNQAYKAIGNGWTTAVIVNLLKQGLYFGSKEHFNDIANGRD
jgi:site-specific DNA-cytosine methylase